MLWYIHSLKFSQTLDVQNSMGNSHKHTVKKSNLQKHILQDSIHMKFKNKHHKSMVREDKIVVTFRWWLKNTDREKYDRGFQGVGNIWLLAVLIIKFLLAIHVLFVHFSLIQYRVLKISKIRGPPILNTSQDC